MNFAMRTCALGSALLSREVDGERLPNVARDVEKIGTSVGIQVPFDEGTDAFCAVSDGLRDLKREPLCSFLPGSEPRRAIP
jgi:hypothetical protein